MTWQIIGDGAIGCLWAANLLNCGQQVHLISRKNNIPQRINYTNLRGEEQCYPCSISQCLSDTSSPLIVCVKAPQVLQALKQYRSQISEQQVIILMHNGMGCAEQVAQLLPQNPIICATTANASLLSAPFNIVQTGLGVTYFGPFNCASRNFASLLATLNQALGNCHWCEDIEKKLWLKLLINIAINPLSAIFQISNGELSKAVFQDQIKQLIKEAMQVLKRLDLKFDEQLLLSTINGVIDATSNNYSSMNRDIFYKRPTEIEYINGYLLKKAQQLNIETPLIRKLYNEIIALESH